jgi:hypothetical protein
MQLIILLSALALRTVGSLKPITLRHLIPPVRVGILDIILSVPFG